ncbi:unnamed protein product [Adineta ricciae]|uniref:BPTI/Kunitz inhibitor domain-containing protein n=1 Tax=Adineta ricciae TaxID=249248 RepID=A0A814H5Y2_ADIRI|nr:unnamed protein product [Adineta ricciae]
MTNSCSCMLSLLLLLFITHYTNAATLRFPLYPFEIEQNASVINHAYSRSEYMNSQIPLLKRLKRWSRHGDNDEVEIALDTSDGSASLNATVFNVESTTEDISVMENDTNNRTTDEQTTMRHLLLRQDSAELNQTDDQITSDHVENSNHTSYSATNATFLVTTEEILESTTIAIVSTQIIEQTESVTSDVVYNSTIVLVSNVTIDYPASYSLNDSVTTESIHIDFNNTNLSQKDAIIPVDSDFLFSETEFQDLNISANLTSKEAATPLCDSSCQCLKECLYGFEILNDTCLCTPPCQNYPCFGTDECVITEEGHPHCEPANGTEHDRPTRCYQPRDAGYHDTDIRYHNRWYYHPDQDTCHLFVYRGVGGNENNFLSLHECHLECITCGPSSDRGECLGRIDMWYYDNKSRECRQFEYSGCKGNENKFLKKEQCTATCIDRLANGQ